MKRLRFLALAGVLALGACASGSAPMAEPAPPPEPEHFDPTGEWEIAIVVEGQPVDGVMTISGSMEEGYEGYAETAMGGAALLVEVDGMQVRIVAPDAGVEILCEANEDGVLEGEVTGAMGGGSFWASRVSGD